MSVYEKPSSLTECRRQSILIGIQAGQLYHPIEGENDFRTICMEKYGDTWKWRVEYMSGSKGFWFPETIMKRANLIGNTQPLRPSELKTGMRFLKIKEGKNQGAIYTLRSRGNSYPDMWTYKYENTQFDKSGNGVIKEDRLCDQEYFVWMGYHIDFWNDDFTALKKDDDLHITTFGNERLTVPWDEKPTYHKSKVRQIHDEMQHQIDKDFENLVLYGASTSTVKASDDVLTLEDLKRAKEVLDNQDVPMHSRLIGHPIHDDAADALGLHFPNKPIFGHAHQYSNEIIASMKDSILPGNFNSIEPTYSVGIFNTQEKTMISFEQYIVTEINGRNADDMTDEHILATMETLQEQIDTAEGLKVKSKTNANRIKEMKENLKNITEYLDTRGDEDEE